MAHGSGRGGVSNSDCPGFISSPLLLEIAAHVGYFWYEEKVFKINPTEVITKTIGIYLGEANKNASTEVKSIYNNSPAKNEGIKTGDNIIAVNGIEVLGDYEKTIELIKNTDTLLQTKRTSRSLQRSIRFQT